MKIALKRNASGSLSKTSNSSVKRHPSKSDNELKMSANAARKAKIHSQRVIAMLYCFLILAIGLSLSLYCAGTRIAELEHSFVWFYTCMYLTSVAGMIYMLVYIFRNRNASIEAIQRGHLSAPRILYSLRGEPVSLYLRIGLCIFAAMAIVFAVFRATEVVKSPKEYDRVIPYTISKILYFTVQPIFFLLLHRLVVLAHVRLFSFLLLHMLTVNLCIWVESAIEKVSQTMNVEQHGESHQNSGNDHHYTTMVTSYFLPAIPEYCAIAVAVVYEMSQRIGQLKQIEAEQHSKEHEEAKYDVRTFFGPAFGIGISVVILAVILVLENAGSVIDRFRNIIHLTEFSLIQFTALVLSIAGLVLIRNLKFSVNFAKNSLDEKLLLVTFFLSLNFFVVCIVMCIVLLRNGNLNSSEMKYMAAQLVALLLELIEVLVQTYFIHDMFYRCCHHEEYQRRKPGRTLIVLLSALNFSLWMIYSFQVKHNDILFSKTGYLLEKLKLQGQQIFVTVMLPMVMLFRYHSSVCLAISFVRTYEDEVTRYESMLRWVKQGTTKDFLQNCHYSLANTWQEDEHKAGQGGIQVGRNRSASHPVTVPNRIQVESLSTSDKRSGSDDSSLRPLPEHLNHTLQNKERTRRDTRINLEMARIRVAASEEGHRMMERKLQQQKMRSKPLVKSVVDVLEGKSGRQPAKFRVGPGNYDLPKAMSNQELGIHVETSPSPDLASERREANGTKMKTP
ncbi:hypothetical protein CSKR_104256 [Clonorchis sinensis]|uniref:Otopetrin n=1 Tax=Clonorchis sinensis TaxID=79923 RepID=A0A3R7JYN3_CLOSI|nr:hypothetical protein CSKR_104256 [Clonorchis sinensis]